MHSTTMRCTARQGFSWHRAALFSASCIAAQIASSPAFAQSDTPAAEEDNSAIREIIVTAERRAQNSQEVPLSLTTFSGDDIAPGGISNLGDIAALTPNLTVTQFNIGEPQLYLRGVGSTLDSASADPTVSVFVDEVYIGRPGSSSFDLYDLDRIEVLRGPQGTLYGRNVTGGAISVFTKKPSSTFGGKIGATIGNYGLTVLRGYVTGPLAEGINGKLSFSRLNRSGYAENVTNKQDLDDAGNFSVRGQLLFMPTSATDITLTGDYSRDRTNGDCRDMSNFGRAGAAFGGIHEPLIIAAEAATGITGPRQCAMTLRQFANRDMGGVSLRIAHDLGGATLTSITSYRRNKYAWLQELTGQQTPPSLLSVEDSEGETSSQWTQELRLGGGSDESGLNWVVGLYGLSERVDRFADVPVRFGPTSPVSTGVLLDRHWTQDARSKSAAIFGQATYEFLPDLSLTLGGRYTWDRKEIDQFYRVGATTVYDLPDLGKTWKRFTGRVTLDWKVTDDVMAYATYSQGYKSGLFVSQNTSGPAAATPLEPEDATNWEAGVRSQFFDRHVQLNVTVFDLTVKNLQLFRLVGVTLVSENANARVKGLEADLQIIPVDGLRLGGSLSLLDPKYRGGTFDGNQLARAPKWKFSLDAEYTHRLANDGEIAANVSLARSGAYFMESTNAAVSYVQPHRTIDASLKYTAPGGNWDLSVWGKNLTDELIERHSIVGSVGGSAVLYMPPRTFGASVNVKF